MNRANTLEKAKEIVCGHLWLAGNIIDYIQHRTEFERWKREQEALKDGSTSD